MAQINGLNRRNFLRSAGITAIAGAVSGSTTLRPVTVEAAANGKFDFDTPYNRIGTDSTKWDSAIRTNSMDRRHHRGDGHRRHGLQVRALDHRSAHQAYSARELGLPRHAEPGAKAFTEGIVAWNKKRYGVDINPESLVITTGVHPGIIAALRTFSPPGSKVLLTTPTYNGFYGDLTATGTKPKRA